MFQGQWQDRGGELPPAAAIVSVGSEAAKSEVASLEVAEESCEGRAGCRERLPPLQGPPAARSTGLRIWGCDRATPSLPPPRQSAPVGDETTPLPPQPPCGLLLWPGHHVLLSAAEI